MTGKILLLFPLVTLSVNCNILLLNDLSFVEFSHCNDNNYKTASNAAPYTTHLMAEFQSRIVNSISLIHGSAILSPKGGLSCCAWLVYNNGALLYGVLHQ
jgi:hypothetical protein